MKQLPSCKSFCNANMTCRTGCRIMAAGPVCPLNQRSTMESLNKTIEAVLNKDLLNICISGPRQSDRMKRYDVRPVLIHDRLVFQTEGFDGTQVFHENLGKEDLMIRLRQLLPAYRNVQIRTVQEEISALISKKGKTTIRRKRKENAGPDTDTAPLIRLAHNRSKRYILPEGVPVPFLIDLGVMSKEGQILRKRYDKFRQINRFLEFIEDILPALEERCDSKKDEEITILDFGCGKSYLTFAMYYYLHVLKGLEIRIIGLDRKKKVIRDCQRLAENYGYDKLTFLEGNIEDYEGLSGVDMVVTLHACDIATDYALAKAIQWGAKVILSVPCCQHELNGQYRRSKKDEKTGEGDLFSPISDYGILKERFCALATDGIRAKMLESKGYRVAVLEFIDMEHTPKNLLIRAVLKEGAAPESPETARKDDAAAAARHRAEQEAESFSEMFGFRPAIVRLVEEEDLV